MISFSVHDESQVAETRREAVSVARANGFDDVAAGRIAIIATELCTNLVKHGGGGEVLIGPYDDNTGAGLELIALDKGPGLANVKTCLTDGYSTAGSPGNGLGAIMRLSDVFDIVSWPTLGAAVLSRVRANGSAGPVKSVEPSWGGISVAKPGEAVCGDAWCIGGTANQRMVLIADGLGHGADAAVAAMEAVRIFRKNEDAPLEKIVEAAHAGLRHTRGAALAVAQIKMSVGEVGYCGLGNIVGAVLGAGQVRRMVSHNGTAGHAGTRIKEFVYPIQPPALVVMHSDGLSTSWSLDRYPGLSGAHPALVAAILYRDHRRGRDDATVVVVRGTVP